MSLTTPTFQGKGARILGIEGTWNEQTFHRLFQGHNPDTDVMLPGLRNVANRRGAFDHTANRDKATSLLKLLGEDDRIAAVERRAEEKAMALVEKQACVRVRKEAELRASKEKSPKAWKYPSRETSNIVWVRFTHAENRQGEPHSHSHHVIFNISYDKAERQWKALELRHIDRKEIGRVYHQELARGMRKLGYKAKWDGQEISVDGVPKKLQEQFSQRGQAVKELKEGYEAKGGLSKEGRKKAQLFNRPDKPSPLSLEAYRRIWAERCSVGQLIDLKGLIDKAKATVSRAKVRESIQRHLSRSQSHAIEVEHERAR